MHGERAWLQAREVGQMSSGQHPLSGAERDWRQVLIWLVLLQRKMTSRQPELDSRSTVYLVEQDGR